MRFLIIQTAFIGDAILATSMLEKLHQHFPSAKIDFMVRKGNESLFHEHPFIHQLLVWDKKQGKWKNLFNMIKTIRQHQYDKVINLQRFFATGLMTALSASPETIGFDKNPLSFFFSKKIKHIIGDGKKNYHEVERNQLLIKDFTDEHFALPRLYPTENDFNFIRPYQQTNYVCIAPSSVWFTKQWSKEKWIALIQLIPTEIKIYLLGAPNEFEFLESIKQSALQSNIQNLAGKISLLQSAALMKGAIMNYVNDSAPMHLCSAVDAPVTAIYCSTLPSFGFGPLSNKSFVIETKEQLACRPCGLHGKKACPEGHFKCSLTIDENEVIKTLYTHVEIS